MEAVGPPWRLVGEAIVIPRMIDAGRARSLAPPELDIVRVLPGRTLGGLILARYERGSTLEYSELIAVPAIVRRGRAWGIWVSHIYVDDETSVEGGRAIWGLPKQLAVFDWSDDRRRCTIMQGGETLCDVRLGTPRATIPIYGRVPTLTMIDGKPARFIAHGKARAALTTASVDVPANSPCATQLECGVHVAIQMRLDATVQAPDSLTVQRAAG